MESFDARYRRLQEGDLSGADAWIEELRGRGEVGGALRAAGLLSFATGAALPASSQPEVLGFHARRAVLSLDAEGLASVLDALHADPLRVALWGGFYDVLFGQVPDADRRVYQRARELGDATMAIDAITLEAASAMARGELESGLGKARRAARMAETEHLWLPHYFAGLFLARLRRLSGTCHAAVRIADAGIRTMPRLWHGWLEWERVCAGAQGVQENLDSVLGRAAGSLHRWLRAPAQAGKEPAELVGHSRLHRRDIRAAHALFGMYGDGTYDDWSIGVKVETPPHMHGFIGRASEGEGALVLLGPARRGRRLAQAAIPAGVPVLGPSKKQAMRVGMLLSSLALAGEGGVSRAELFEQTYGFAYSEPTHEAAFRVLRHHAKRHVADYAKLSFEEGLHRLTPIRAFALRDPRTVRSFKDMMLRLLARRGGRSARSLATDLGVPLRTVQAALKEMVGDGACAAARQGNRVTYEVEDTTFTPLTMG